MKDPTTVFTNYTGAWPNVLARNISAPADGLGTEWIAEFVDTVWGSYQAIIDSAGLTPDGVTEAAGTSQLLEAMQKNFGHPGEMAFWQGQGDPSILGIKLLPLEGQGILRANYVDLDTAVWVGSGLNGSAEAYFRADAADGTGRNPTGIYLILADVRGQFIRGRDTGDLFDPGGSTRGFPSFQSDAVMVHGHELRAFIDGQYTDSGTHTTGGTTTWEKQAGAGANRLQAKDVLGDSFGASFNDDETRPSNWTAWNCIRY